MNFKDCSVNITINQGEGHPQSQQTYSMSTCQYPSSVPLLLLLLFKHVSWPPCTFHPVSQLSLLECEDFIQDLSQGKKNTTPQ